MKILTAVNTGKSNLELLKMIQSNLKLSRKELVDKIVSHSSFIYKGKHERSRAWDLVKLARKSSANKPYEVRDTNGGKKNGIWICYFDFSMIYAR